MRTLAMPTGKESPTPTRLLISLGLSGLFFLFESIPVYSAQEQQKKPPNVAALIERLKHEDESVRRGSLAALGRAGKDAKAAIPAITDLLKDKNAIIRIYSTSALRKIDPQTK